MEPLAIVLVIISALIHSFWNLLSKKSRNKVVFNWLKLSASLVIYLPVFLYLIYTKEVPSIGWMFIVLSAVFHTFYYYFLSKSYQHGHLSLVYPITRSSSLFVPFLAVILIKEKLSMTGILGIVIILVGIYLLHLRSFKLKSFLEPFKYIKEKATIFALLTALLSAFYSVNDKMGVGFVFPILYIYLIMALTFVLYLPIVLSKNNRGDVKKEFKLNRNSIILAGFLGILSYVLTLFAFQIGKVSYVVSLRQLSVVFGVILGTLVLKEKYGKIRLVASIIMFIGFMLVAVA